jgi:hypothetical protein
LQRVLPGISTEQLRSRLNRMVADGMLTRKRYREVPPRVDYELTERARDLMPVLGALARWGYEWTWSEPRASETVDIGAIFRLAPGLLEPTSPARRIALSVTDTAARYTIALGEKRVEVWERDDQAPDARVEGTSSAWMAALSPAHDRAALDVGGDSDLARAVLDGLTAVPAAGAAGHRAAA